MADTGDEFAAELCRLLARRYGLPVDSIGVTQRARIVVKALAARDRRGARWVGWLLVACRADGGVTVRACEEID